MVDAPIRIWQLSEWPCLSWSDSAVLPCLQACHKAQGRLLGLMGVVEGDVQAQDELDTLLENIVTSSAIEGEDLNAASVRSSLARRLGVAENNAAKATSRSEGLAELMLDATRHYDTSLDVPRLLHWHGLLFPAADTPLFRPMNVGTLRGEEPMQVVSGRIDRPTVHFEAPPRAILQPQVDAFVGWFNASRRDDSLDPLLRAALAHFWFITLHPFDDGNGRITRALTDLALAQADSQAIRFHSMSASILADRAGYYRVLESTQRSGLDITPWIEWFLRTLHASLLDALTRIELVIAKARYWQAHRHHALSDNQVKVLNRLLEGGERGFEQGISASKYQVVARVSKATATRHLADLVAKGCIERLPGGGRSARYTLTGRGPSTG